MLQLHCVSQLGSGTCFLLRRRLFTNSPSPTVIISLTRGGLAPLPGWATLPGKLSKAFQVLRQGHGVRGTLAFLPSGFRLWGRQEDELPPPRRGVGEGMSQAFLLAWFSGHRCLQLEINVRCQGLSGPSAETYNEG